MKRHHANFSSLVTLSEAKGLRARFSQTRFCRFRCAQNDIAVFVLIGLAVLTGCSKQTESPGTALPSVKIQTLEAQVTRTPDINELVGTVRARHSAAVAAKIMAGIQEIPVHPGDPIGMGQTLAKLDARELRAEFEKAKGDFERYEKLLASRAATPAEFDSVQSRYRVAEAALSDTTVTAPFDGVVAEKLCHVGDMAAPGKALFVVEQAGDYRLETNVPERFAGILGVGKSVYVVIEATGEKCTGKIGEIVPAADPVSRSILIKIDLPCRQALRSGMFGRAQLPVGERFAMFVPKAAVHERGQLTYVFIADTGKARMRLVRTGKSYLDAVEILSGVQSGERVIVSGRVSDGQPVSQ